MFTFFWFDSIGLFMSATMKDVALFMEINFAVVIPGKMSIFTEAVTRRCPVKKVFLKIPQNSQENTCARVSFLIKLKI